MLSRRLLIASGALLAASSFAGSAFAQDWKSKYPELTFAIVPSENASGVQERFGPFLSYLSKELGVPVKLRIAQDYAAVIEGQRAGNVQIANYGPAAFARAIVTGVKTEAFAIQVNGDGTKGYYSVFYVLAKSPYKTLEDLKGKNIGLVDPNSTSGNNMPLFKLNQLGINPDTFFGKAVSTGSHENAVLALASGQVDVATNWWNADDDSNLTRMLSKGMLKNADGSVMKKEDFRVILTSDMIINSPIAYLADLPDDLKTAIRNAFLQASTKDKAAFDKLSDGKDKGYEPTQTKDYDKTIELIKFVDSLRKKSS